MSRQLGAPQNSCNSPAVLREERRVNIELSAHFAYFILVLTKKRNILVYLLYQMCSMLIEALDVGSPFVQFHVSIALRAPMFARLSCSALVDWSDRR